MTTNELKDRILEWCAQASEIAVVQDREEPNAEVALLLRLNRPEGARVAVFKAAVEDRLTMLHALRFPAPAAAGTVQPAASTVGDAVDRVVEGRSGWLSGSTRSSAEGQDVTLSVTIYEDGLSKHAFLGGLHELTRVRSLIQRIQPGAAADVNPVFPTAPAVAPARGEVVEPTAVDAEPVTAGAGPQAAAAVPDTGVAIDGSAAADARPEPSGIAEPAARPQPTATPAVPAPAARPAVPAAGTPVPAGQGGSVVEPSGLGRTPAPEVPQPARPAWAPSHRVPPAGMDAWSVPDPTQRAVARIDGGVPVQVTETAGAWAHVLCSNGWRGWVDYRILVAVGS